MHKEWSAHAGEVCNFKQETIDYLDRDVKCLLGLVSKMGHHMFNEYKADIRHKTTIGSLAEHIWQHALLQPIPKLKTEKQHNLWQKVNKGCFCVPL